MRHEPKKPETVMCFKTISTFPSDNTRFEHKTPPI